MSDYQHDTLDVNLNSVQRCITYDGDGEPSLRVSIEQMAPGTDLTITGDVIVSDITGTVEISNDEGSAIPTHSHLFDENDVEYTDTNPLTIDGNVGIVGDVNVTQGTSPWEISGNVNATVVQSVGANKPFYLEVAQGLIAGYSFNHKFGAVPSMSGGGTGSIWDVNDTVYPWDALGAGSIVNVERNDIDDNGITVTVQGLDENYQSVSEDILITGPNQTGSQLFTRVNRAFISGAATNEGDINIQAGVAGGTIVARISQGFGQTLMALYTIPAGKTGYVLHGTATGSSDTDASGMMMVRYFGTGAFRIGHAFELQLRGGQYDYTFQTPIPVPEKTDIDIRAVMRSNNKRITAAFDILLVDNA